MRYGRALALSIGLAVFVAGNTPPAAGAEPRSPNRQLFSLPYKVPDPTLRQAYLAEFLGWMGKKDPVALRKELLLFAMRHGPESLAGNRAHIVAERWHRDFLRAYDAAIVEADAHRAASGADNLALSRALRDSKDPYDQSIALTLRNYAGVKGVPGSSYDHAQDNFRRGDALSDLAGVVALYNAADDNYGPAQLELIERHMTGNRAARSLERAYYWALKAANNGLNVDAQLEELRRQMTANQRRHIEEQVSTGEKLYP